jgi:membrane associated rhomboid family serine protease
MFAVWMFGRIMEMQWGSNRFLMFYLICGIGAGLTQELFQFVQYEITLSGIDPVTPEVVHALRVYMNAILTVGASGAVYGILLGYGMTFPENQLFIIPIPFPIKAKWLVVGYVVIELVLGLKNSAADNVAHFAHLGGMLAGFLMILYWRHKERKDNHIKFTW